MDNGDYQCGQNKKPREEFNGNRFVRISIELKDEPDQYGKDVSISIKKRL